MLIRMRIALSLVLLLTSLAIANQKKKIVLPPYVLKARTVLVLVNPDTGVSVTDPGANRTAQEDVEKAMMNWGRLTPVMTAQTADLVIMIRRGHGKLVEPTIGGGPGSGPGNNRPVIIEPTDSSVRIGAQKGRPPDGSSPTPGATDTRPHPKVEMGPAEDMFEVYQGGGDHPLDGPPAWRYVAKDALRSPSVPAVAEFRKAIEEAEKQQKSKP